jgi:hypothetical protein
MRIFLSQTGTKTSHDGKSVDKATDGGMEDSIGDSIVQFFGLHRHGCVY